MRRTALRWLLGACVLGLWIVILPTRADAQEPRLEQRWHQVFPEEVLQALGARLLNRLSGQQAIALKRACPQEEAAAIRACLESHKEATAILSRAWQELLTEQLGKQVMAGEGAAALLALEPPQLELLLGACPPRKAKSEEQLAECLRAALAKLQAPKRSYSKAALGLLPAEALAELPQLVTAYLSDRHWLALKEKCPQKSLEARAKCLDSNEVEALLDDMVAEGVTSSILAYMDAELPHRLTPEDAKKLASLCAKPGEVWAKCMLAQDSAAACAEPEEPLAQCLSDNDLVSERYLQIRKDKKAIFGKELFVELGGFVAVLTSEQITQLRQACPQQEKEAALACFETIDEVKEIVTGFHRLAQAVVQEAAAELLAKGVKIDVAANTQKLHALFLTMPLYTIDQGVARCEKAHPKLAEPQSQADIDELFACVTKGAETDPVSNPAFIAPERLRQWISIARGKVVNKLRAKEADAQSKSSWLVFIMLLGVAGLGFIVVQLTPLWVGKDYAGDKGELWKASAIAASTFALTVILLGGSLLGTRAIQGALATDSTSPKMRLCEGAFDVLAQDKWVEGFSNLSRYRLDFIKGPLKAVVEGDEDKTEEAMAFVPYVASHWTAILQEPELSRAVKNALMLKSHIDSFKSVLSLFKQVSWALGYVPFVLSLLTVLLYLLPLKGTLMEIAEAPLKAAEGGTEGIFHKAMGTVWAELKSAGPYVGLILVLLPITGWFLSYAVQPLIELLLAFSLYTVFYILLTEASGFVLYTSLGSTILLLVLCLLVYILAISFFIGTARKILRAKYHFGHTLRQHRKFWLWGSVSLIAVQLFPVLFVYTLGYITFDVAEPDLSALDSGDMLGIPVTALLVFPLLFWAARGFWALNFVRAYQVDVSGKGEGEGEAADAAMAAATTAPQPGAPQPGAPAPAYAPAGGAAGGKQLPPTEAFPALDWPAPAPAAGRPASAPPAAPAAPPPMVPPPGGVRFGPPPPLPPEPASGAGFGPLPGPAAASPGLGPPGPPSPSYPPPSPSYPPPPPSYPPGLVLPPPQPPPRAPQPQRPELPPPEPPPGAPPPPEQPQDVGLGGTWVMNPADVLQDMLPKAEVEAPVELTVEQYAELRAELAIFPERRAETLARYGIADEITYVKLGMAWEHRLAADQHERNRLYELAAYHADRLRSGRF